MGQGIYIGGSERWMDSVRSLNARMTDTIDGLDIGCVCGGRTTTSVLV